MQRKIGPKSTRGPNTDEKRFQAWVKGLPCIVSGNPGPSILHHCEGSTFRHNKILVGHWFVIPLCPMVDDVITRGSRRAFREQYGAQSTLWLKLVEQSPVVPPSDVIAAIRDWGK